MQNGPSLGCSCVENGSHPVSAALDFLDEGSGSFCGDTYYLRYLDNTLYLLYLTGICTIERVDQVSVRLIFKPLPWALVMMSSDSRTWMSVYQNHSLENTTPTMGATYYSLTMKELRSWTAIDLLADTFVGFVLYQVIRRLPRNALMPAAQRLVFPLRRHAQ
jgi:hypothetical protein